jgi:rod shape-determining protein MreD
MTLHGWLVLALSFVISLLLMIAPTAPWLSDIWPIWLLPVLFYWIMALPHRVGIFYAWFFGIILDLLYNSLIGTHALALVILAGIFIKLSRRFSFFSGLQQVLTLFFLNLLYLGIIAITQLYSSQTILLSFWWPALTTALIWPFVHALLRHYRRRFRMT